MKNAIRLNQNEVFVQSYRSCKSLIQRGYDIVKAHHGELKVKSEENKGSGFSIQLPTKFL